MELYRLYTSSHRLECPAETAKVLKIFSRYDQKAVNLLLEGKQFQSALELNANILLNFKNSGYDFMDPFPKNSDFSEISEAHKVQANILKSYTDSISHQFHPCYYFCYFIGNDWPNLLSGQKFILRFDSQTSLSEVFDWVAGFFDKEVHQNMSTGQVKNKKSKSTIQIFQITPVQTNLPEKVSVFSHYYQWLHLKHNQVSTFYHDKALEKNGKILLIRRRFLTKHTMPSESVIESVVLDETFELKEDERFLVDFKNKNSTLLESTLRIANQLLRNEFNIEVKNFGAQVSSVIQANVNGGLDVLEQALGEDIPEALVRAISYQLEILEVAMRVYDLTAPIEMQAYRTCLEESFILYQKRVGKKYGYTKTPELQELLTQLEKMNKKYSSGSSVSDQTSLSSDSKSTKIGTLKKQLTNFVQRREENASKEASWKRKFLRLPKSITERNSRSEGKMSVSSIGSDYDEMTQSKSSIGTIKSYFSSSSKVQK